ncbi:uncharacterized protein IWZ02DRAFT_303598 [Phyllosticta citriasiana]|uniref:uncharacterized protein n=1 Tax=Phyllosticta citriasiana TaxID=595635 RepID=UPI0030FDA5C4
MEPSRETPPIEGLVGEHAEDSAKIEKDENMSKDRTAGSDVESVQDQNGGTGVHGTTRGSSVPQLPATVHDQQMVGYHESTSNINTGPIDFRPLPKKTIEIRRKAERMLFNLNAILALYGDYMLVSPMSFLFGWDFPMPVFDARLTTHLPGKNLDVSLTKRLWMTRKDLTRDEKEFFQTHIYTLNKEEKKTLYLTLRNEKEETHLHTLSKEKKRKNRKLPQTKKNPKQSANRIDSNPPELKSHLRRSQKLPVTRHVIHREKVVGPCNHFNPLPTRGWIGRGQTSQGSFRYVSPYPNVPSSSALPVSAPINRASSTAVPSSPALASTPYANRGIANNILVPPTEPSIDPTSLNTNTHVWNWRTRTYEPVRPEQMQEEELGFSYAKYL